MSDDRIQCRLWCSASIVAWIGSVLLTGLVSGCASAPTAEQDLQLRELSTRYLRSAVQFEATPAVRAQAIEAAADTRNDLQPLIRNALKDPRPAVRFAACMAVGKTKDTAAMPSVRALVNDPDASVRIGAYFALERLGNGSYRSQWTDLLRHSPDPAVRRNAALALGQLKEPTVLGLLQRAVEVDKDEGVRIQALEGMVALGDQRAIGHFVLDAHGGKGAIQPFALLALGQVKDERVMATLRGRLAGSPYLEARLAAARSLGRQGSDLGYELALYSLEWNSPTREVPEDLPETQVMRVRTMAAMALGEIGDARALPALKSRMQTPDDPRVQLAAARAILLILDRLSPAAVPTSPSVAGGRF